MATPRGPHSRHTRNTPRHSPPLQRHVLIYSIYLNDHSHLSLCSYFLFAYYLNTIHVYHHYFLNLIFLIQKLLKKLIVIFKFNIYLNQFIRFYSIFYYKNLLEYSK